MDVDNVRRAAKLMREAQDILASGPLDYYLLEMAAAHDMLMSRFAPFKVGDRVVLTKGPDFSRWFGWKHSAHFLVPGAAGVVVGASCGTSGFSFSVVFDDESWIDDTGYQRPRGSVVPVPADKRHTYSFGEGWLEREPANVEAKAQTRQRLSP